MSERFFDVPGLRLAAKTGGDPQGLPILALHGWLDNANSFDGLIAELPGFDWLALDFAGHGLSAHRPLGARYHLMDYVADVLAVIQQVGWDRFFLVGHSMGAGVAVLVASVLGVAVERLVLIDGLGPISSPPLDAPSVLRTAIQSQQRKRSAAPCYPTAAAAADARVKGSFSPLNQQAALRLCERGLIQTERGYRWRTDARLKWPSLSRLTEEQVVAFLADIRCPSLFVCAEAGLFSRFSQVTQRVEAMPGLQVQQLPGGHHLHLEEETAPQVAACVREFLMCRIGELS